MGSVNRVFLVGNLGRDAELRHTPSGSAVGNFSLATTDNWTDKAGQRQERTEWHRVDVWGRQAESLQPYLTKGKQVFVEGRIQTDEWNDRDGNKRYTTKIVANRITLLGSRGDSGGGRGDSGGGRGDSGGDFQQHEGPPDEGGEASQELNEDDIPF